MSVVVDMMPHSVTVEMSIDRDARSRSQGAAGIVVSIAASEIMPWAVFLLIRYPRCFGGNMPTISFLLGAIFWVLSNFFQGLQYVFYYFPIDDWSVQSNMLQIGGPILYVCQIVMLILSWIFFILLCFRWTRLHDTCEAETENDERRHLAY
ncbi:uncharacterized protein BDV17DRAFT_286348 [Aspergillus undulatus]|uniref:uncharacterized protein n=1 Tax=Aspergillus undulatus TaxID=1810928 RepID=UPI003CCC9737